MPQSSSYQKIPLTRHPAHTGPLLPLINGFNWFLTTVWHLLASFDGFFFNRPIKLENYERSRRECEGETWQLSIKSCQKDVNRLPKTSQQKLWASGHSKGNTVNVRPEMPNISFCEKRNSYSLRRTWTHVRRYVQQCIVVQTENLLGRSDFH